MLLCWGLVEYLKALRDDDERRRTLELGVASLIFALLVMTRPDGLLAYGLLWLHAAWSFRAEPRKLAIFSIPFVSMYTPYFLWRWHYYGAFLPNTYYGKSGGALAQLARGSIETVRFLELQTGGLLLVGLVGLWIFFSPTLETTVMGLAAASRILFEVWSGGQTAGRFRFLLPALPLVWIMTERTLISWLRPGRLAPRVAYVLVAVSGLFLFAQLTEDVRLWRHEIEPEVIGTERSHIALGKWLKQNSPPEATVAVGNIGAIGYWSHLRVLDLDGLTDAHIAHLPGAFGDKRDSRYVLSQSPEFIILRVHRCSPEPQDISLGMDQALFVDPGFQNGYHPVRCWDFWESYHLMLYATNHLMNDGSVR